MRAELSPAQVADHLARRKVLWRKKQGGENQVAQVAPPEIGYCKPPPQDRAFAADTAEKTGVAKSTINRSLARAKALGEDLGAVQGTSLDKRVELDALAKMPEPERKDLIARAQAGERYGAQSALAFVSEFSQEPLLKFILGLCVTLIALSPIRRATINSAWGGF